MVDFIRLSIDSSINVMEAVRPVYKYILVKWPTLQWINK